MMRLPILKNGNLLLDENFLINGQLNNKSNKEIEKVGDLPLMELEPLSKGFVMLINKFKDENTDRVKSDSEFSIYLHQNIRINRNTAAISELWHYLSMILLPNYVVWRWKNPKGSVSKERYLGGWNKNAIGRLWWWAELTVYNDDYSLTTTGAQLQDFVMPALDNLCGGNKKFLRLLILKVFPDGNNILTSTEIAHKLYPRINAILVTLNIDYLDDENLSNLTDKIISGILNERNT